MRRRSFLGGSAAMVTGVFAGCTELAPQPRETARHPFADRAVTVAVESTSEADHDFLALTRASLEFWEAHADAYLSFRVAFDLADELTHDGPNGIDPDGNVPDLLLSFADDPRGCENVPNFSDLVLGCAPILTPGSRVDRPVIARVVAANRPAGSVLVTTKHEIGHVLGLTHDDEPREIMSNRPEDRIPLYDRRLAIWEVILESQDRSRDGIRVFNHGIDLWKDEQYGSAVAAFESALADFSAAGDRITAAQEIATEFIDHPRRETIDLDTLEALFAKLEARTRAAVGFAGAMEAAARAAVEGDDAAADGHRNDANSFIVKFNDTPAVEVREIAVALALVSGLERDDTVVDEPSDDPV